MATLKGFDASNVKPAEDFGIIPAGEYTAIITESVMKPTKNADGNYLELTLQIVGGEYANRKVWSRLNLDNKNPKAVEIAERELSAICHAVGILKPEDSAQLHNKPLTIRLDIELAAPGKSNKDSNQIKAWKPADGAVAQVTTAAPATRSPWGQKAA